MNYSETLNFLYSKLPMFTRIGEAALKKDLHNTLALCGRIGDPQNHFRSIHIGGTNGKGSTSHMLAAILQKAGYKTGLYTSPHLKDFRERIRINGEMIPEEFVTRFVGNQLQAFSEIQPSFFEVTVAMAFDYFAAEKVDIAIIEVGLGGRLDSTNIIHPDLSVITNISLDHTNILGSSLEEIAFEKAGIIKKNTPVVVGEKEDPSGAIFEEKAAKEDAALTFASELLHAEQVISGGEQLKLDIWRGTEVLFPDLVLDLAGTYQVKNIKTVIASVLILREKGYKISDEVVYAALKDVKNSTGLQGRWQIISHKPLIICDTGHNVAGIREVLKNIHNTPYDKLHMVIGMVKDKDIDAVLELLPGDAIYYFTQPALERAMPASMLKRKAQEHGLSGDSFVSIAEALNKAKSCAGENDLIFAGGSTFVVAEVI